MHKSFTSLFLVFIISVSYVFCAVVSWGEKCDYTAECGDHRLVCDNVTITENKTEKICVCDRYHEWNGTLTGCVQKYKVTEILGMVKEKYNVSDRIEYEANLIFLAQIVAGIIVLTVGLVCSVVVSAYCYHMWKEDTELDEIVHRLESLTQQNKANRSALRR